jgi:hypothetical protein
MFLKGWFSLLSAVNIARRIMLAQRVLIRSMKCYENIAAKAANR